VLTTMKEAGVDAQGLESEGWLYAQLHLSRPAASSARHAADLEAQPATRTDDSK
jgi:hypothetical protein